MRKIKASVGLAAVGVIALAVIARGYIDQTGGEMTTAAARLFASLDEGQKAKALFKFDDPERKNWHFIPRERKGLPIKEMTSAQRALAFALVKSGGSGEGFLKATTIMSLEDVLKNIEKGSGPVRDPERYFVTFFGEPSDNSRWGWRVEGHHLSLNFVLEGGKIVAATPAFFGSNPAEVKDGPRRGTRALGDLEDRALRLVQALTDDQKKAAIVDEKAPADIRAANTPQPPVEEALGLAYEKMSDDQKAMLRALVDDYAEEMPAEVSRAWLDEIRSTGPDSIKFAWMGVLDRSQGHAYRIQGPTFLIEFNNTQNGANHIHSVWRSMLGDFNETIKK